MSDPEKLLGFEIDRTSPEVEYHNGRDTLVLTWENTVLFQYDHPCREMDHALVTIDDDTDPRYIFGDMELAKELYRLQFPTFQQPYPTDTELRHYGQWLSSVARELDSPR